MNNNGKVDDGWVVHVWCFMFLSISFKSYQADRRVIMNASVQ